MAVRGAGRWKNDQQTYTERQIKAILKALGIKVNSYTSDVLIAYCPFHGNRRTPSFSISKRSGLFICFNPSCGETGNLNQLVGRMTKKNQFEVLRFIYKYTADTPENFMLELEEVLEDKPEFIPFDEKIIDRLTLEITDSPGYDYMIGRGFTPETISKFGIGYSELRKMVTVPVHSPDGMPLGFVGRSIEGKEFKNSNNLPTSKTMFNIHRAKRTGADTLVVVEGSFDTMKVEQAGYPNVAACLMGHFSPWHKALIERYFNTVIIMTDDDELIFKDICKACHGDCVGHNPGRDLGLQIEHDLDRTEVLWASYEPGIIYPGSKDPDGMAEKDIRQCIENAVYGVEYHLWYD